MLSDLRRAFLVGLVVASACAANLSAEAQTLVIPVYRSEPVRCGDGHPPRQAYTIAQGIWDRAASTAGDEENMTVCAAKAATAGYAPAQTLFGRILSHARLTSRGTVVPAQIVDLPDALYWFEQGADGGDGRGAAEAGNMYEYGAGTAQSDDKAWALYQRAVALGYKPAEAALAHLEERPARLAAFEAEVVEKARAGDGAAMRAVATAYLNGAPYAADAIKAFAWMRRAAEAGDTEAMVELARMYRAGAGTDRDDNAAADWFMKAWTAGARGFAGDINILYYTGQLDDAHKRALEAFSGSSRTGRQAGAPTGGAGVKPDAGAAPVDLAALEKAARGGAPDAVFNLAVALLDGSGGPADPKRARELFLRVANRLPEAAMNLGDIYYTGKLGKPDMAEAVKWYAAAGGMGDGGGARNAALIYRDGADGVPQDKIMAYAAALLIFDDETGLRKELREQLTPSQRAMAVAETCLLRLAHYPE